MTVRRQGSDVDETAGARETVPAPDSAPLRLHALSYSLGLTAAVTAAARLGLADVLGEEPLSLAELAERAGAQREPLGQLMLALACHGVFRVTADGAYAHSEMSRLLRSDEPGSRRAMALLAGAPFAWRIWGRLDEAVRSGTHVFRDTYGKELFAHLHEDEPELGELFGRAMAKNGEATAAAVTRALDLAETATVADIGGGHGTLLKAVLETRPAVQGVLFDLPEVTARAHPELAGPGSLADRCRIVSGDCHQDVPVTADVYVLKGVLHMWNDDTAVEVLRRIGRHAPAGARIVVAEQILDVAESAHVASVMNLLMLVSQGGRERTTGEFEELFARAGLTFRGVTPTGSVVHLLEAVVPGEE